MRTRNVLFTLLLLLCVFGACFASSDTISVSCVLRQTSSSSSLFAPPLLSSLSDRHCLELLPRHYQHHGWTLTWTASSSPSLHVGSLVSQRLLDVGQTFTSRPGDAMDFVLWMDPAAIVDGVDTHFAVSFSVGDAEGVEPSQSFYVTLTVARPRLALYTSDTSSSPMNETEFEEHFGELFGGHGAEEEDDHAHGRQEQAMDAHGAEEGPSCHPVGEIFAEADANQDGVLETSEAPTAFSTLFRMLAEGCHLLARTDAAAPVCVLFAPSSEAQRWGYTFLSIFFFSICPLLLAMMLLRLMPAAAVKWVSFVCLPTLIGMSVGIALFIVMPWMGRSDAILRFYRLDGALTATQYEYDFIFPLIVSTLMVMGCFVMETAIHKWHGPHPSKEPKEMAGTNDDLDMVELSPHASVPPPQQQSSHKRVHVSGFLLSGCAVLMNLICGLYCGGAWSINTEIGLRLSVVIFVFLMLYLFTCVWALNSAGVSLRDIVLVALSCWGVAVLGGIIGAAVGPDVSNGARWLCALLFGLLWYSSLTTVQPQIFKNTSTSLSIVMCIIMLVAMFIPAVLAEWGPHAATCVRGTV